MIREKIVEKLFSTEVLEDLTALQEVYNSRPTIFVLEPLENLIYYFKGMRSGILDPYHPPNPITEVGGSVRSALFYRKSLSDSTKKALSASNFFAAYTRLYSIIEEVHSILEENSD